MCASPREARTLTLRLGILLSGRGSNFLAIAKNIREGRLPSVEIAIVLSNIADAPGIAAASDLGLKTAVHVSKGRPRAEHDRDMLGHPARARRGSGLPGRLHAPALA